MVTGKEIQRQWVCTVAIILFSCGFIHGQGEEEYEPIDEGSCVECHETGAHETVIAEDISHSSHEDIGCLDCHGDKDTMPHRKDTGLLVGDEECRGCHEKESEEYKIHGRLEVEETEDIPSCASCHGDHDILPSTAKLSKVHPVNLPGTCGICHEDLDLTRKYELLLDHPVEVYENSIHGKATRGGIYVAATCNDCHSTGGSAHRIFSPGNRESAVNHFNIPKTCGECHKGIESDFWEGIHGKLVARGETDAPVCTDCHGEHGIISPSDPRSPVSRARVAEVTCSPCHESTRLNEKYGLPMGRLVTFIDSYHGLKSKAGDVRVANCASCHGVHRILPSSAPTSTIHPSNLRTTCGECHPGISAELAATPIHGISGEGLRTPAADVVEKIYIAAIIVIIGLMVIHWVIDLIRQIRLVMAKPQVRRMTPGEVWQHSLLMISFIVLIISGFSLRFSESWISTLIFGWSGGFEFRGTVHRYAAVVFMITALWHVFYLFTPRGSRFVKDIWPRVHDFREFWQRILYNLGRVDKTPQFKRFSYIEKAEYWALAWGTVVMIGTGLLLWFDNYIVQFLPRGVLDVSLVIHYWEAWLATLAVFVWHLWSTVFNPHVYPMNPSWMTGRMPEDMYAHEHPKHLDEAKRETKEWVEKESGGASGVDTSE
ncbi:MAG: cytochrome b/b6 domain-containing protein [Candidatus Neomarinimicrobiota bacterium]